MNVNSVVKFLLILTLLQISASAGEKLIGSIGFVSPAYPEFGRLRPSQDVSEFFDDFIETAHSSYGDAGVSVVNRLNMKRGEVIYDDIEFDNTLMIPSEDNKESIEKFYKNKGVRFFKELAKKNHVDIILTSKIHKAKLRRIFQLKLNPSKLVYKVSAYDVHTGATKFKYINIEVVDLFTYPDYDPDELQALFIEKYLMIFQEILGHMKTIGSSYSTDDEGNFTETASSTEESSSSASKETASEDSGSGDW